MWNNKQYIQKCKFTPNFSGRHVTLDPFTMAKSRTYRCEGRRCAQSWVCAHPWQTQSHLPREIPALMWKQQQSHLPGYKPGLQVILLTMTVILDLKEQCGRSLRQAPPPFKWNRIIGRKKKNRQVCNYSNRSCFLTDAFRAIPVKNRTARHEGVRVPIREPNNPQKKQDVQHLAPVLTSSSACRTSWKTLSHS